MKRELKVTVEYYDKYTGEYLGNDPKEVFPNLPLERRTELKRLFREIITGVPHVVRKDNQS